MEFENVKYSFAEDVATVSFNRPDALNALSLGLTIDVISTLEKAVDDGARAIILTGEGRAFCAGGDLREMKQIAEREGKIEAFFEDPLRALHDVIKFIRETPIPFIAAVNGICAGAGTNFALACDIVIAAENAVFNEAFSKIGLTPDCGGSFFLPRVVGEKIAAELFFTGDALSAERALALGMVNKTVAAECLMEEATEFAARLAKMPTGAIGRIKKMLNASFKNDLQTQLDLEHQMQIESGKSEDFKEGVAAFFEKRAPQFKGK